MACTKPLTISQVSTGDMGLDQAIYESTTQKIFGVRGQWLFQFNSVSGALEQSLRFANDVTRTSTITALGGTLYIGTQYQPNANLQAGTPYPDVDIYKVNPGGFAVSGRLNLGAKNSYFNTHPICNGWQYMVTVGTKLFGFNDGVDLFTVDPTNVPGFVGHSGLTTIGDTSVDTVNGVVWIAAPNDPDVYAFANDLSNDCFDTNGNLNGVCGVTWWKPTGIGFPNGKAYAVHGAEDFWSIDATGHFPGFTNFTAVNVHTGIINANPIRIKAVNNLPLNPLNGKVLIPCWSDASGPGGSDSVIVWNPITDSVVAPVRTGFTAPFDIVSTPTTNWAVQSGTVGLKQIV